MPSAEPIFLLVLLFAVAVAMYFSDKIAEAKEGFISLDDISILKKRNLWFVVDDFDINSRRWADFGARLNKDANVGFLTLTKARCIITQGKDFTINELLGRSAVAETIRANNGFIPDKHKQAPSFLWKAWARAALLASSGGLYFEGTNLCMGPSFLSVTESAENLVFGANHDEMYPHTPGPYAGWASKPGHISWTKLATMLATFIDSGPLVWTSLKARNEIAKLNNEHLNPHMRTLVSAEWCRQPNGKPIENEDLFGRSLSDDWSPGSNVIYVPVDYERLELDSNFNWFLRMSPEQILDTENSFIWAQLYQKAGRKDELIKL
jgi:hypothetical protein